MVGKLRPVMQNSLGPDVLLNYKSTNPEKASLGYFIIKFSNMLVLLLLSKLPTLGLFHYTFCLIHIIFVF